MTKTIDALVDALELLQKTQIILGRFVENHRNPDADATVRALLGLHDCRAAPVAKLEPLTDADALNLAQNVVANSERPIGAVGLCLLAFRAIEAAHNAKLQTRAGAKP